MESIIRNLAGGLYVHVPFCVSKCTYCDFCSVALDSVKVFRYLEALKAELGMLPRNVQPRTIYIGGGTPTALPPDALAILLKGLGESINMDSVQEWTCEANPESLTDETADIMRAAGVNRVSMGAQSFSISALHMLGRIHTVDRIGRAVAIARQSGIENISLDLMYGLPEPYILTPDELRLFASLGADHLSAYCLSFESGTPLASRWEAGKIAGATDDRCADEYEMIRRHLAYAGFNQYEISNFCQPGKECRHNLNYWSGGEYYGVGPSAHSHINGVRYGNTDRVDDYLARLLNNREAVVFRERLPARQKAAETLMLMLRKTDGVSRSAFKAVTGFDFMRLRGAAIEDLCERGLLELKSDTLRLTPDAFFISDAVFRELI